MFARHVAIRRVAFWTAMLTGAALVASQFACTRPQTMFVAPGFPHASRLASPTGEAPWSPTGLMAKASWATATYQHTASTPNQRTIPTTFKPPVTAKPTGRESLPTDEPVIASVIVGPP